MGLFDFFTKNWKKQLEILKDNVQRAIDRFGSVEDKTSVQFSKMILGKISQCKNETQFKMIEDEWNKFYKTHSVENDTAGIIYRPSQSNYRTDRLTDALYTADAIADIIDINNSGENINSGDSGNSSTWEKSQSDNS